MSIARYRFDLHLTPVIEERLDSGQLPGQRRRDMAIVTGVCAFADEACRRATRADAHTNHPDSGLSSN